MPTPGSRTAATSRRPTRATFLHSDLAVLCGLGATCGRTGGGGEAMTKRLPVTTAPVPLEEYVTQFDDLFARQSQREGFPRYLEGLLLPAARNKTATGLANTEPTVGAQDPRAQALQGF